MSGLLPYLGGPTLAPVFIELAPRESFLIIETGAIVTGANTFIDPDYVTAYVAKTGNATWATYTLTQQEQALFRAMQYLEGYERRWKGCRVSIKQELSWPRKDVEVDGEYLLSTEIPRRLKEAQAEIALREAAGARTTIPDFDGAQRSLRGTMRQAGPLKKQDQYATRTSLSMRPAYPIVDELLGPYLQRFNSLIQH